MYQLASRSIFLQFQADDDCIEGFISVDRMDRPTGQSWRCSVVPIEPYQGIFPEVGFTCNGSIHELGVWSSVGRIQ